MWIRSICFLAFWFHWVSFWGVLRAEEPGPWYLISETELRSIEQYREQSEAERQRWLSQVRELKTQAESLRLESVSLNRQLAHARAEQRKLEGLFEQYETDRLTLLSSKNGEIAELKEQVAAQTLSAEQYKGRSFMMLIIIIALGLVMVSWIAYRVCKLFRLIPG